MKRLLFGILADLGLMLSLVLVLINLGAAGVVTGLALAALAFFGSALLLVRGQATQTRPVPIDGRAALPRGSSSGVSRKGGETPQRLTSSKAA